MPVYEAVDNLSVEPNHIYVIPPNRVLTIVTRLLRAPPAFQADRSAAHD